MSGGGHWTEAWRRDCERVGLSGTSVDLVEIKRAYARTLRVTRPDEDAQAYQALREAYDRVVAHARGERRDPAPREAAAEPRASEEAVPSDDDGRRTPEAPEALVAWVEAQLPADSPAEPPALAATLSTLRLELQRLPLSATAEASVRFADLLIRLERRAPAALAQMLNAHFGWIGDFRAERLLGTHRLERLRLLLAGRLEPVTDPALLRDFGPLVRLQHWRASRTALGRWRALLAIVLMGHALLMQLTRAGVPLLRRLGIGADQEKGLRDAARYAVGVHLALMGVMLYGVMRAGGADEDRAWLFTWLMVSNAFTVPLCLWALHLGLSFVWAVCGISPLKRLATPLWYRVAPWLGTALLVVAGVLGGRAMGPEPSLDPVWPLLIATAGLVLSISQFPMFASAALLWALAMMPLLPDLPPLWAGLAAAWIAAGMTALRQGLYEPDEEPADRAQPTWPRGGPLALIALCTVGLPILLGWLSVRCGLRLILGGFMLGMAMLLALHEGSVPKTLMAPALPALLLVSLAVLLAAQRFGWWAGRLLVAHPPEATA